MSHRVESCESFIFGKMPVIVDIGYGYEDSPCFGREYYEEVEGIWWRKKDGTKGKHVPEHLMDRLEEQDMYLLNLIESCWVDKYFEDEEEELA